VVECAFGFGENEAVAGDGSLIVKVTALLDVPLTTLIATSVDPPGFAKAVSDAGFSRKANVLPQLSPTARHAASVALTSSCE
jgi:hypothetical protein